MSTVPSRGNAARTSRRPPASRTDTPLPVVGRGDPSCRHRPTTPSQRRRVSSQPSPTRRRRGSARALSRSPPAAARARSRVEPARRELSASWRQFTVASMLREIAEYPNAFGPLAKGDERIDTGRYTLCMGPGSTWNTVQRQRFPLEQVDEVLDEVRETLRARGRTRTQGEVGSSAPAGLVEALLERGVVPDKDPYAVALVLTREPPPAGPGLTARRIETLEEFEAAAEVQWEAFGATPAEIEEARALLPSRFLDGTSLRHAVWLNGEIVGTGTASLTEHGLLLYGGATAARARGRGAYRALNRARWDDAVSLGTPVLITQGGSMSRPILERLGFERVGELHILLDVFE